MRLLFILLLLGPCFGFSQSVKIGSKAFTESYVLSQIARKTIADAGVEAAVDKDGVGNTMVVWKFLRDGEIHVYPEYTGTISEEILKKPGLTLDQIRSELDKLGLGLTSPLGFNNTYALAMKKERAAELGISKISDLKNHPDLQAGPTHEFLDRSDGWKQVMSKYGVDIKDVKGHQHTVGYAALNAGTIDIKDCYSTDAEIAKHGLVVLEDDLGFFPSYLAVFVYRKSIPGAAAKALESLAGTIDDSFMSRLNSKATDSASPEEAANMYFREAQKKEAGIKQEDSTSVVLERTWEHLQLVSISLLLAILVGIPLGIWAARGGWLGSMILGITGVIQTIPSIALLVLLLYALPKWMDVAIVALFLYSLLPIVRNTATGISTIAAPLRESAEALGLEAGARLRKVYLPLALPTIMAGVKTSAVINVGTATIAGFIGAGGYGSLIFSGLALSDSNRVLQGAIPSAIMALVVQFIFDRIEHAVVPRGLRL